MACMPPPLCTAAAADVATAAAHLSKADLATHMVTEMTALAGTMGRHYALKQGVDAGGWAKGGLEAANVFMSQLESVPLFGLR